MKTGVSLENKEKTYVEIDRNASVEENLNNDNKIQKVEKLDSLENLKKFTRNLTLKSQQKDTIKDLSNSENESQPSAFYYKEDFTFMATEEGQLEIFNNKKNYSFETSLNFHEGKINCITMYKDELYTAGADGKIINWFIDLDYIKSSKPKRTFLTLSSISSIEFRDDNMYSACEDGSIRVWDLFQFEEVQGNFLYKVYSKYNQKPLIKVFPFENLIMAINSNYDFLIWKISNSDESKTVPIDVVVSENVEKENPPVSITVVKELAFWCVGSVTRAWHILKKEEVMEKKLERSHIKLQISKVLENSKLIGITLKGELYEWDFEEKPIFEKHHGFQLGHLDSQIIDLQKENNKIVLLTKNRELVLAMKPKTKEENKEEPCDLLGYQNLAETEKNGEEKSFESIYFNKEELFTRSRDKIVLEDGFLKKKRMKKKKLPIFMN